MNFMTSA
jgi:hypothetical protein